MIEEVVKVVKYSALRPVIPASISAIEKKVKLLTHPKVFILVFFSDGDLRTTWIQFVLFDLAQELPVNAEEHLESALFNVVVPDPQLQKNKNPVPV